MGGQAGFEVCVPIDQALARRTSVLVLLRHVDEVLLAEASVRLAVGCQRLRDIGGDARLLALQDLVAFEVAAVGNDREVLEPVASRACCAIDASWVLSLPMLVTSCATIRWCLS